MEEETKKKRKKSLIWLVIGIIVFLVAFSVMYLLYQKPKPIKEEPLPTERTLEEIIQDLTAPEGAEVEPVPEEVIKDLSAPEGEKPELVPEDIIKDLTAPSK